MKKQFKKSKVALVTVLAIAALSTTVFAAGRWVQAWQDDSLKIKFNGVAQTFTDPDDGSKIVPLVYNGRTYLPVRAIAGLAGLGVDYDEASNSVLLTSGGTQEGPKPVKDSNNYNDGTTTQPTAPAPVTTSTGATSHAAGTVSDPVRFGDSFSWFDQSNSSSFGFKSNVTMSVTNVKQLTDADIAAMGFKTDSDTNVGHVLVTLNIKGKNVTATNVDDSMYYNLTKPNVWGAEAASGDYVIGGTDYGFDGSIDRNLTDRYQFAKMEQGDVVPLIDYSGNVILPIIKGQTNYLVIEKSDDSLEGSARKIYFKLN